MKCGKKYAKIKELKIIKENRKSYYTVIENTKLANI